MRPISSTVTCLIASITLCMTGCSEHLPPYAPPTMTFEAGIVAFDVVVDDMEEDAAIPEVEFAVDVTNIQDPYNDFYMDPPIDIRADVTVFDEQNPTRKREVRGIERVSEVFAPGMTVRIIMPLPTTDQNGYPWCWELGGWAKRNLVLQGKVHIPREDAEDIVVNTPRKIIQYLIPPP